MTLGNCNNHIQMRNLRFTKEKAENLMIFFSASQVYFPSKHHLIYLCTVTTTLDWIDISNIKLDF